MAVPLRALILGLALALHPSCSAEAEPPAPPAPVAPASRADQVSRLVIALNAVEAFPVSRSALEAASGVRLADLEGSRDRITVSMSGPEGQIDRVSIEARGQDLTPPPPPKGATAYERTLYAYLPTVVHAERVGDRYRALLVEKRREGALPVHVTEWTYTVSDHRGVWVSEAEKQGGREVILGLLQAVKEDRFEAAYVDFVKRFPADELGSHPVYDTTTTIRYFDDRIPERADPFLAEDGLIAYVGIHVWPEQHSKVRYSRTWLFDFFGVERIDAARPFAGAPYNPVNDASHPMAGVTSTLPEITGAGQRDGGLLHYSFLEWRDGPWTLECPGAYPHDGKVVPTLLDPALLQIDSFAVTHSRKKGAKKP